jgi:hypothetical protein
VHGELGLDLELARERREALHESLREHAVAREHVVDLRAEQPADEPGEHAVAEPVARAVRGVVGLDAAADHHVEVVLDEPLDERGGHAGVVGVVAVDHDVEVGLDVLEHPAHDVALALAELAPHDRAGRGGDRRGLVGRVVVVDVDRGLRQRAAEVGDHLRDRGGFVVAGDEDRDLESGGERRRHVRT